MAAREQSGTNIEPGLIQRVSAGLRYLVSGVGPESWFGPQQPLPPQAQDKVEGRAFDYPVGYNLRISPREGEAISFAQLRGLADSYDLMRLVIETRKDQIEAYEWEIVPADGKTSADKMKAEIRRVTDFMASPDKEHDWPQWLRMQLEDLLVIDTMAVYPRASRGGELYAFELIDGGSIKRLLDDGGRTPLPPSPAFQQVLKGIPAADYSRDQLVYKMRNPRTNRVYGFSPVEQVVTTVNIALRRQMSQLSFYTEGNVPEALAQVPESWTMKQIADFQTWWDSVIEGNVGAKRKMRFMPSLDKIVFPKDQVLKDEMDEWLARIVCFAFSISPSALIKQVNRASGQQMADTAKEEGLMPLMRFLQLHITTLIQTYLCGPGLRFQFKIVNRVAPEQQAQIHDTYVRIEAMTPDEVREDLGKDPMTPEERAKAFPLPMPFNQAIGEGGETIGAFKTPGPEPAATKPPKSGTKAATDETPPAERETAAEKMLAQALRMLDPTLIAKMMSDHVRAQPPQVIEFRPETNVAVGDTNVHVPIAKADVGLEKRAAAQTADLAAAITALAERPTTIHVEPAQVTTHVHPPAQNITLQASDVRVETPVTVQPAVTVPVRVDVPPVQNHVYMPAQGPTEEVVERNERDDITRIVRRPLKP